MRVGALCRCIKKFDAVMPDELSLYDGDLFQVSLIKILNALYKNSSLQEAVVAFSEIYTRYRNLDSYLQIFCKPENVHNSYR